MEDNATSQPAKPRDLLWYKRTVDVLKLLLNGGPSEPIKLYSKFGTHGYDCIIFEEHITYLRDLNAMMSPISVAFDDTMIHRWRVTNELLITNVHPVFPEPGSLQFEFPGLAMLMACPLVEELSRRISNAWDEDGFLNIDIPREMGLWRINSKGEREPKDFKKGHRIVDLSHKLFVMKSALSTDFQKSIDSLDRRLSRPLFPGGEAPPHVTLFERIELFRNIWLHGRRFESAEALPWLITLCVAMLYFGIPASQASETKDFTA